MNQRKNYLITFYFTGMAPLDAAGLGLKNKTFLKFLMREVQERGLYIEPVIKQAIENGAFNLLHNSVFSGKKRNLVFNGKHFQTWDDLIKFYNEKPEKDRNYKSVYQNANITNELLEQMVDNGSLRIIPQEESASLKSNLKHWFNPIGLVNSKNLIIHFLGNAGYTKPCFTLSSISKEHGQLKKLKKVNRLDLAKCYNQYSIDDASKSKMYFEFEGICYQAQVLMYGPSAAVFLVENFHEIPAFYVRSKYKKLVIKYGVFLTL